MKAWIKTVHPSSSLQGDWPLSPAVIGREAEYILDRSPVFTGQHRETQEKQPCTHKLGRPINIMAMVLDCGSR